MEDSDDTLMLPGDLWIDQDDRVWFIAADDDGDLEAVDASGNWIHLGFQSINWRRRLFRPGGLYVT